MTSAHRSARQALISTEAFRSNFRQFSEFDCPVDLTGDAFGHGIDHIISLAQDLGVTEFSVARERDLARVLNVAPAASVRILPVDSDRVALLYGLQPSENREIKPVMTLTSEVIAVKPIEAGGGVSYGYTWRAPSDGWLALCALGYADGFNRAWGNRIMAHQGNLEFPAVGRVAMDAHSISTGDSAIDVGSFVFYFGTFASRTVFAQDLAETVGSSPLSVTSGLTRRVARILV